MREDFDKPKIVYMEIQTDNENSEYSFPRFAYDWNQKIVSNTGYIMTSDSIDSRYLLAVLNSKIGRFIARLYVSQLQSRGYRMLAQYVQNFPIPQLSQPEADLLINLATAQLKEPSLNYEEKIDTAVCSWYSLDYEELQFIRNSLD